MFFKRQIMLNHDLDNSMLRLKYRNLGLCFHQMCWNSICTVDFPKSVTHTINFNENCELQKYQPVDYVGFFYQFRGKNFTDKAVQYNKPMHCRVYKEEPPAGFSPLYLSHL